MSEKKKKVMPKKSSIDFGAIEQLNQGLIKDLKLKDRSIMNFKKDPVVRNLISTRRPTIDFVTGGGFPEGSVVIVAGAKHSGKTSLCLQIADSYDGAIAYLDTEFTTDTKYIESLGIDSEKIFRYKAENIEQMSDILRRLITSGKFEIIIWDSVSNIASMEELAKESGDRTRANSAIVLSTQFKIWAPLLEETGTTLVCITHVSQNQNKANKYSPDYIIPGGERMHHNSSLTLMLSASSKVDSGVNEFGIKDYVGRQVRIVCEKNKSGAPLRSIKTKFVFGRGYTIADDVLFAAKESGIVTKGTWSKYGEVKLGQGETKQIQFLEDNPEILEEIREKTMEVLLGNSSDYEIESVDAELAKD